MKPRILVFAGSVKSASINEKLVNAARLKLTQFGADVTHISLLDYPMPLVNEDSKDSEGIPESAMRLGKIVAEHSGVFIASPEYNSSIPPLLKNMVDWVSLMSSPNADRTNPWHGRYIALGSASDGSLGGIRGLYHLRSVMMNVGAQIITEQCSVRGASSAFDENGRILDERTDGMLKKACKSLIEHCGRHGSL